MVMGLYIHFPLLFTNFSLLLAVSVIRQHTKKSLDGLGDNLPI